MECNHITPEAKGGPNTFYNCIPLCFDCHAEVGHYSNEHPKGIKFTPEELRQHRDRWYKFIETGIVLTTSDYADLDRKLFFRLLDILGGSPRMLHFKDHDYGSSYSRNIEESVLKFLYEAELPETEFLTLPMEAAFSDFKSAIRNYRKAGGGRIWWETDGWAGIPREWLKGDEQSKKRFWDAVEIMNSTASNVWSAYARFIGEARRLLNVEIKA